MPRPKGPKRVISDPTYRARMEKRSAIIGAVRAFFASRGFLEVETPVLVAHPGMEPHLDPFETTLKQSDGAGFPGFLITSPEYAMKKLLAAGLPKIFEIAKCFRNGEPSGGLHNPEFTMIEWYRADADYADIMRDTELMVQEVARAVRESDRIVFRGREIDLAAPWDRMTVAEAFARHAGIDLAAAIDDEAAFRRIAEEKGNTVSDADAFDDIFFKIFLRDIEPKLGVEKPVILYEYPRSMAALARLKSSDPRFAERFEVYCAGMELANAFSELNDAVEQRRRLEEEQLLRRKLGRPAFAIDEQFIEAVGSMPRSSGIALGVDRLVMLLTDARDIRDVLFFPAQDLFSDYGKHV